MSLINSTRVKLSGFRGVFPLKEELPLEASDGQHASVLSTNTLWVYNQGAWHNTNGDMVIPKSKGEEESSKTK